MDLLRTRIGLAVAAATLLLAALASFALSAGVAGDRARAADAAAAAVEQDLRRRDQGLERRLAELWTSSEARLRESCLAEAAILRTAAPSNAAEPLDASVLEASWRARSQERAQALAEAVFAEEERRAPATPGPVRVGRLDSGPVPAWVPILPFALLAAFGAAAWLAFDRAVAWPSRRLAAAMDEVAAGGVERTAAEGAPALQTVSAAFNRMADALFAVRRDLEARVDAETAALGRALVEQRELNDRLERVLEDLRSAQERAIRQEKMAAIGTLAGGVAHEFNNLLGGIRGCAEQALEDAQEPDVRQALEIVVRAARRGRTIVDGLLRFSQGARRVPQVLDLARAAAEACELLAPAAAERKLALRVNAGGPAPVLADPVELQQVVTNLVLNAIQASASPGEIEVAVASDAGRLRLEVRDRGAGVPRELRTRIYEPFFTTRERSGGTGLGLAITLGIVQGLGGTLSFHDRDGGGTVFVAELPAAIGGNDG